jgi:hypothetical protein
MGGHEELRVIIYNNLYVSKYGNCVRGGKKLRFYYGQKRQDNNRKLTLTNACSVYHAHTSP